MHSTTVTLCGGRHLHCLPRPSAHAPATLPVAQRKDAVVAQCGHVREAWARREALVNANTALADAIEPTTAGSAP